MIEARDLRFTYPGTEAEVLRGLSLASMPGEILGILGPNGSGKTTLLKLLCGLLRPSRGSIFLENSSLQDFSKKNLSRKISFVPQSEETFLPFTVEQIVLMGRFPYVGLLGIESDGDLAAAREAMEATTTWTLRKRTLHEISGGEKQRVGLARALAQQTPLVLLDEPTSHLDLRYQIELLEILSDLNRKKGITVILSLHDLNLASLFCHRLLLLKEGMCHALGTPREVLKPGQIRALFGAEVTVISESPFGAPFIAPRRRS